MAILIIGLLLSVAGVIAGVLAAAFAWRDLYPVKRELRISILSAAPAVPELPGNQHVELKVNGADVGANGRLVTLEVRSSGRADITKDDFHDREPLKVKLIGSPIKTVLSVRMNPKQGPNIPYEFNNGVLKLGP